MSDKKPPWQSSEDRDLAAIQRRQSEQDAPDAAVAPEEEDTRPTDLVELRYQTDPSFRALWDRVTKHKRAERSAMRAAAIVPASGGDEDGGVDARVHRIESALGIAKWLIGILLVAVLGTVITIATKLWNAGYTDGETEIRIQHLERDVQQLQAARASKLFDLLAPSKETRP